jgi:hypothetical protein
LCYHHFVPFVRIEIEPEEFLAALRTGCADLMASVVQLTRGCAEPAPSGEQLAEMRTELAASLERLEKKSAEVAASVKQLVEMSPAHAARLKQGHEWTKEHLRAMTREWIASGIGPDGCEFPFERSLMKLDHLQHRVNRYLQTHQSVVLSMGEEIFVRLGLPDRPPEDQRPEEAAMEEAERLFVCFVHSPWRHRLGWCKRCENFFLAKRKPRKLYKRGWYCSDCRHAVTAERGTRDARRRVAECRLELAALATRRSPKATAQEIAAAVNANKRLLGKPIKANWVTRNRDAIQRRIKEGDARRREAQKRVKATKQ